MQLTLGIYGASAFGYAQDSDFQHVGYSAKQWQKVIDAFYNKYTGIAKGHERDIKQVKETGILETYSGRFYKFVPETRRGEPYWPITQIKNYPIQGLGADLVKLARIEAFRRFKQAKLEGSFISTVHDSLVYDVPSKNVEQTADILKKAVAKIPQMCYNYWEYKFKLPVLCEVSVGTNFNNLKEI
jgi:DNA polymerase I